MRRRPQLLYLLWAGLSLLAPRAARADGTPSAGVPPVQKQAFLLGYALQIPAAQAETFLQSVKGLKAVTDDAQGAVEVSRLAKQSEMLRAGEERAYRQATQLLHVMDAPPDLQAWAGSEVYRFGLPLVLSKEAKSALAADPNAATVLGTIDEAQAVATDADGRRPGLISWLKLRSGPAAVWATAVGGLAAGMHASVTADRDLYLSRTEPMRLRNTAPFGTPGVVLDALTALSPSTGNLARLIRLTPSLIPPGELRPVQKTLIETYGARAEAATIDKGP